VAVETAWDVSPEFQTQAASLVCIWL